MDEKDMQAFQTMMSESERRMMAYFESAIMPKFDLLAEGQQAILGKLVPRSRVDELEEEIKLLKIVIRQMNADLQELKKAN